MDNQTFRVLEFEKVLRMASEFAATAPGRTIVEEVRPCKRLEDVRERIDLVSECRRIYSEDRSFPIEHFDDLTLLFQKVRPADALLQPFELNTLLPLFFSALGLAGMVSSEEYPGLGAILKNLTTHDDLKKALEISIEKDGTILDNASPELAKIRRNIKSIEKKIKGVLDGILRNRDLAPYLQDYFLAERVKRWVIPVKRDFKGRVPGVVHDISNTGETVYVEPFSIQNLGNELESYRAEEKLEEFRILQMLSSLLRANLPEIEEDYRIVAEVDALQATARFADQMGMSPPEMNSDGYLKIRNGRHPLLWKTLMKTGSENDIVPLTMEIGRGNSCMVITGSNAGGKTVALKTTGVLVLMALSGMHVPAGSGTTINFFSKILADIGDEQSIEQNLSTFSAHIRRIAGIIHEGGTNALVIIDELGTGTDPEQGGALSCAVLRKLNQGGALSIVSTHLGMLKAFAHSEQGTINSAMEMKEVEVDGAFTFRPTYKLIMGEPGTSHAFEIAESLGLPQEVISDAKNFISGEDARIESLISELKHKNSQADARLEAAEKMKKELNEMHSALEKSLDDITAQKRETLAAALGEAEEIIRKAKLEASDALERIRKAELKKGRESLRALNKRQSDIKELRKQYEPEKMKGLEEAREGQRVYVHSLGAQGTVLSINEKTGKCRVLVNEKEITLFVKELSHPLTEESKKEKDEDRGRKTYPASHISDDLHTPDEINIVGKRVDPALSDIERYLNDVSLSGLTEIKIIHGIGKGILASAIREYLSDHPLVESYRTGDEYEGGGGVTVVKLKE